MGGRLSGKVALVTGAGQGIGEGIAALFAAEGATVLRGLRRTDGSAGALALDVADPEDWAKAHGLVEREHGRLDILVHNAGITGDDPVSILPYDDWRRIMSVNLDGVFLGSQAMLPLLRASGAANAAGASVVVLASINGIAAMPNQAAYGSSKAAVRHLSKVLAVEWGQAGYNIRVNAIEPGTTRTRMFDVGVASWARTNTVEGSLEAGIAAMTLANPLQRIGTPTDIAHAALYLASDDAGFVSGSDLVIDGGYLAR